MQSETCSRWSCEIHLFVEGRSPSGRLIRDIRRLSTAYFADSRPTEFLVGTALLRVPGSIRVTGITSTPQTAASCLFPASRHGLCKRSRLLWTLILFFSWVAIRWLYLFTRL